MVHDVRAFIIIEVPLEKCGELFCPLILDYVTRASNKWTSTIFDHTFSSYPSYRFPPKPNWLPQNRSQKLGNMVAFFHDELDTFFFIMILALHNTRGPLWILSLPLCKFFLPFDLLDSDQQEILVLTSMFFRLETPQNWSHMYAHQSHQLLSGIFPIPACYCSQPKVINYSGFHYRWWWWWCNP